MSSAPTPLLTVTRAPNGVRRVSVDWLLTHADQVRLIDVREPEEFTGPLDHLPAAELVPLGGLLEAAARWPRDQPLVLICRSDKRSDRGALALEQMGFSQTASMIGGMIAWVARG